MNFPGKHYMIRGATVALAFTMLGFSIPASGQG
jgi:hypothetical protein